MILLNEDITNKTRFESWITTPKHKRKEMILDKLAGKAMTARELAYSLGFTERNAVAPRLTEMMESGEVVVCGKRKDSITGKTVAVYRVFTE